MSELGIYKIRGVKGSAVRLLDGKGVLAIWKCRKCHQVYGIVEFDPKTNHGKNLLYLLGWKKGKKHWITKNICGECSV